jgi:RNA polymerase II-associated factor 1
VSYLDFTGELRAKLRISSKLDLLVRVRYNNPLPTPPFPPKLLKIPTNPSRYARPEFIAELAYEAPLPMVVDAECGMPLDLGKWDCLWEENADKSGTTAHLAGGWNAQ